VLLNLLGNAVKFTDAGHVALTVTGRQQPSELGSREAEEQRGNFSPAPLLPSPSAPPYAYLRFEVIDTGPGIPPDQLEHIFQPFQQVDESDRRTEGTGLGLAISQQIVQLMGSRLQVKSPPSVPPTLRLRPGQAGGEVKGGAGSAFWFEVALPVTEVAAREQPVPIRNIVGYEGVRRRVLVADDKLYNRMLLVDMLTPLGFEVSVAEDGQQAVNEALALRPDAIVIDLVMPVKTGVEAAQEIRQRPEMEGTIIIAVSASVLEVDREKSRVAGCNAFLPKPVKLDSLLDLLAAHLKLTWVYAEPEEPAAGAEPLLPPPPDLLAALYELARMGEILEIQEQALRLEEMDVAYIPFARKLQELAKGFEIEQINAFVKQFLEEEQDDGG
jgi:CheY-like chemotaxis protein